MTRRGTRTITFLILVFSKGGVSTVRGQSQNCPGCYPPTQNMCPACSQPSQVVPNYNSGIPGGPPSTYSGQNGWTVPVPNSISISQTGQVYFHYGMSPSMRESVPVSGIDPFTTFNGMNGMPHWSSLTMDMNASSRYRQAAASNYSGPYAPSPFGSGSQTPI